MAKCMQRLENSYNDSKPLIPLKIVVFCFYGGIFSLTPFLSIHMQSLGLSIQQTAVVYSVLIIASCAGSPIAGYLTDKTGKFQLVVSILLITSIILHTCLLFVPPITTPSWPVQSRFICSKSGSYLITEICDEYHSKCSLGATAQGYKLSVKSCQEVCPGGNNITRFGRLLPPPKVCFGNQKKKTCPLFTEDYLSPSNFSLSKTPLIYDMIKVCVHRLHSVLLNDEERYEMWCPGKKFTCRVDCDVDILDINNSTVKCTKQLSDPVLTFYLYFGLRFLCMLFMSANFPLIESAILIQSRKHKAEYGKQRVWSTLAMSICPPVVGVLVDEMAKLTPGPSSFLPAFVISGVLLTITMLVVVYSLDIPLEPQPKLHLHHLKQLCHNWDIILLYGAVFFLGAFWGFLETFLFWFLSDIGSSKFLLGFSRTMGGIICIPTMFFADVILNRVGRANILIATFMCYALQMICYSFIWNPWWSLGLELLKFFTNCLKIAAAVTLANSLAPKGLTATMQATLRCLQYEIGSGIGNIVGGSMAESLGMRTTFKVLGVSSGILGVLYAVGHFKLHSKRTPCSGSSKTVTCDNENESAI